MNTVADVAVIGGGPGGSTAAGLLSKAGLKVLLFEKEKFPRYQIGESLLPATIHGVCKLLGVHDEIHKAGFVRKLGGAFRWGKNDAPWTFGFGQAPVNQALDFTYAYQVERAKFDNILLTHAQQLGVDVQQEATVVDVLRDGERVVGVKWRDKFGAQHTVTTRYVVDASGHSSKLYRSVGERIFSKYFQNVALFTYFHDAARLPAPNSGNIFCCAFDQGWFWYIPLSEKLTSVGAVVAKEHADSLKGDPDQAFRRLVDRCPRIRALLANAQRVTVGMYGEYRTRTDYSYCNSRFWSPGLILIGDSACFIDPVFSTGVHLATYSGMLGARSIATYCRGDLPEKESMDLFESRYKQEFSVAYDFLCGFYDMHKDEESYYWNARKILRSEERNNHAFLQLIAGSGTTADDFVRLRSDMGELFQLHVDSNSDSRKAEELQAKLTAMDPAAVQIAQRTRNVPAETTRRLIEEAQLSVQTAGLDHRVGHCRPLRILNALFFRPLGAFVLSRSRRGGRRHDRSQTADSIDDYIPSKDGLTWVKIGE